MRQRHADYYLTLAEEAESGYYTTGQAAVFDRLEGEHDNLRVSLDWFHDRRLAERELHLAAALHDFWIARGHIAEGRARLEKALADAADVDDGVRGKALDAASWLATHQLDHAAARRFATESLAIARSLGERRLLVSSLSSLGLVEVQQGHHARGRELYEEALELARSAGDDVWVVIALGQLSDLALNEGRFDDVDAFAREAIELARASDDDWSTSSQLFNLGLASLHRGDGATAARYFEECLDLALGVAAHYLAAAAFEGLAASAATADPDASARLVGAAQNVLRSSGSMLPPFEAEMHARTVELLEECLGSSELGRLRSRRSRAAVRRRGRTRPQGRRRRETDGHDRRQRGLTEATQ